MVSRIFISHAIIFFSGVKKPLYRESYTAIIYIPYNINDRKIKCKDSKLLMMITEIKFDAPFPISQILLV